MINGERLKVFFTKNVKLRPIGVEKNRYKETKRRDENGKYEIILTRLLRIKQHRR